MPTNRGTGYDPAPFSDYAPVCVAPGSAGKQHTSYYQDQQKNVTPRFQSHIYYLLSNVNSTLLF